VGGWGTIMPQSLLRVALIIRVILTNTSRKMEDEYVQRWSLYPRSLEHLARKSINQNTTI
jgi:hypothetical protein